MTEKEFTRQVIGVAQALGWKIVHFPTSTGHRGEFRTTYLGDGKGFPDLVATRAGRVIFAELKVPPNKQTREQKLWQEELELTDADFFLWTPNDWESIERELSQSSCSWG